jgi:hypothetical protein
MEAGMTRVASVWTWGAATVVLMVAALAGWRFAPELAVRHSHDAYRATLGIRGLAVAVGLAAQLVLLVCVIGRVYTVRLPDKLAGAVLALATVAALGTAVVLGWPGR